MKKLFATLLYVVLGLPLALSSLVLFSVGPWAADRSFYRRLVDDDRLYVALRAPEVSRNVPAVLHASGASFDGPALVSSIQKNLPQAELKALGDRAVDGAFSILQDGAPGPLRLDLRPLKTALRSRSRSIAGDYVAALPASTGTPPTGDFTSRPAELSAATETAQVALALNGALDTLPDTALSGPTAARPPERLGALPLLSRSGMTRSALLLGILSALLMSGLAILGADGAGRRLARAGRMVLLPSLIVLGGGILLAVPGGLVGSGLLPEAARPFLSGSAGPALAAYLRSILGVAARGFLISGLVGSSLGGLLISLRRVAEPREIE